MRIPLVIPFMLAAWSMGCAAGRKPDSTVSATTALTGYPSLPSAAVATNEQGQALTVGLDAANHFSLELPRDHRYRIALALADREIPIVFARGSGRFGSSFSIVSGGAHVELGSLRYVASMQGGTMQVVTGTNGSMVSIGSSAQTGECVDGKVAGTETLCVDDERKVSCGDGSQSKESASESCDEPSRAACTDTETADATGADHEASIAETNPPDRVDGCDDGENDDNVEQSGEHED